jgi:Rrf2 family protein
VDHIARALGIPANYLSKTLHALVRGRVLASTRGPRGGFRLAVPPERLSLIRVVAPFEELDARRRCLLGRPECSDRNPCPAHHAWKHTAERVTEFFRATTVADIYRPATVPAPRVQSRIPKEEAMSPEPEPAPPERPPLGQRLMDNPILLLILGILVMFVCYTGWGLWEIVSLKPAPLP